jgi:hypothetical protein
MGPTPSQFIRELTRDHRVVVLGGLAVIAHGLSRATKDADIWLEPLVSSEAWAHAISHTVQKFPGLTIHTLPGWREVAPDELAAVAAELGIIRILGLQCPLDIFRTPNEFAPDDFEEVWQHAKPYDDGCRIPHPLELIVSKLNTGRPQDQMDREYLEALVLQEYEIRLPGASFAEAQALLDRYVDWRTCQAALKNPDSQVQSLAMDYLREMAAEGDPFSQAILENRPIPGI